MLSQRFVRRPVREGYRRGVRWDELFADLERQWEGLADGARQAEIADRTRAEFARVGLVERLRGSEGRHVRLSTRGGRDVSGELSRVGADFVLLTESGAECLLPLSAVGSVTGLGGASASDETVGPVRARLGLGAVLRRIATDRSAVTVLGVDGRAVSGTVQRVGADFVEMVEHDADETVGRAPARRLLLVPFDAIVLVRRDSPGPPV